MDFVYLFTNGLQQLRPWTGRLVAERTFMNDSHSSADGECFSESVSELRNSTGISCILNSDSFYFDSRQLSIAPALRAGQPQDRDSFPGRGKELSCSPLLPHPNWGPSCLLPNRPRGTFPADKGDVKLITPLHLLQKVGKQWSYTSSPRCLQSLVLN